MNIFLLLLAFSNYRVRQNSERELIGQTVSLLAGSGITVDADKISNLDLPDTLTLKRNDSFELALVRYVLGNVTRTDEGGGIYYYQNEKGSAVFRNNGSFEISIKSGSAVSPAAFAQDFCGEYGYSDLAVSTNGGATVVTAVAEINGISVYNCSLTMRFSGQYLSSVSGNYISASHSGSADSDGISAVNALVSVLDYCTREGTICNAITDISVGYILQSTASTPLELVPVWKITTDSYTYYVNSIDNSVELAQS